MKHLLWARWEKTAEGKNAMVLFKRIVVTTARGQALEDIPILVVEDTKGMIKDLPKAVDLELDITASSDGKFVIAAMMGEAKKEPQDPKPKMANFDDPESERSKVSKKRGMGRFLGKETQSRPASKGASPPVPPEQRAGGRGSSRGRRRSTKKKVNRGGAVRGASRTGGKQS